MRYVVGFVIVVFCLINAVFAQDIDKDPMSFWNSKQILLDKGQYVQNQDLIEIRKLQDELNNKYKIDFRFIVSSKWSSEVKKEHKKYMAKKTLDRSKVYMLAVVSMEEGLVELYCSNINKVNLLGPVNRMSRSFIEENLKKEHSASLGKGIIWFLSALVKSGNLDAEFNKKEEALYEEYLKGYDLYRYFYFFCLFFIIWHNRGLILHFKHYGYKIDAYPLTRLPVFFRNFLWLINTIIIYWVAYNNGYFYNNFELAIVIFLFVSVPVYYFNITFLCFITDLIVVSRQPLKRDISKNLYPAEVKLLINHKTPAIEMLEAQFFELVLNNILVIEPHEKLYKNGTCKRYFLVCRGEEFENHPSTKIEEPFVSILRNLEPGEGIYFTHYINAVFKNIRSLKTFKYNFVAKSLVEKGYINPYLWAFGIIKVKNKALAFKKDYKQVKTEVGLKIEKSLESVVKNASILIILDSFTSRINQAKITNAVTIEGDRSSLKYLINTNFDFESIAALFKNTGPGEFKANKWPGTY